MGTLSARTLRESLQKARNIGIVEERLQLFDECEVVVRNLRPDEYEAIHAECKELEEIAYLYGFQFGHVKRAIVELNGQDLRGVEYVEDEEEDPKKPGTMRPVKLELADWLAKEYLHTWGKEAIYVVYRKVEDAVERAEKQAKNGIEFLTPEETDEDRFRRIVSEAKDLTGSLPDNLVNHILEENGLMLKSTAEEVKRAMEQADALAKEQQQAAQATPAASPAATPAAQAAPPPRPPPASPIITPAPVEQGPDPEALMRGRQPMNQADADIPQPFIVSPGQRQVPTPAGPRQPGPPPPEQVHPPIGAIPGPTPHGSAAIRGAKAAALETQADASGALGTPGVLPQKPTEVPVIERKQAPVDPKAAATVMDPKPRGGINPHYRPPPRGV